MNRSPNTPQPEDGNGVTAPGATTWGQDDGIPPELRTYTVEQLALIVKRSVKSLKVDVTRNPSSLPPVFRMPGSRKILFRHVDVLAWMDALSLNAERRLEAEAAALRPSGWRFRGNRARR